MKDGEEFLQSKDIWNHPYIYSSDGEIPYDVTELLDEYAKYVTNYILEHNNMSVSSRFNDDKFIGNVCISYRHDFGLMNEKQRNELIFECKEWMRAIKNNEHIK